MPARTQLQRRAGWRMPPDTLKVDRSTRWGNPLRPSGGYSTSAAVADYRRWIEDKHPELVARIGRAPPCLEDIRRHLAGRNLACWCPLEQPCHADVLLRLANAD